MLEILMKNFPRQIEEASRLGRDIKVRKGLDKILVCGMGGSAISGMVLQDYLKTFSRIPVFVCNSYTIPKYTDKKTLVFISSYSGNTEEAIACYEQVKKIGAEIVILTSGGKLIKKREKIVKLPKLPQPRYAIGASLLSMLGVLQKAGMIGSQNRQIKETVRVIICGIWIEIIHKRDFKFPRSSVIINKGKCMRIPFIVTFIKSGICQDNVVNGNFENHGMWFITHSLYC